MEIATGIHAGTRVFIPRIPLLTPSDYGLPFILKRRQFPGRHAFCIIINKGQSQSLETVGIFLPSPEAIFSHGQLHVALSRVQNPSGLKIMVCGGQQSTGGGVLVKNVVYQEVFLTHVGEPSSSSQDLIDSFLQDDISFDSSQLSPVLSHAKKRVIMADSERKSKVPKIFEFSQSSVVSTLEDPENNAFQSNHVTFESSDVVFNAIIRHPSMTGHSEIALINNYTLAMRYNLAQSIGLENEAIPPNSEDIMSCVSILHYYQSLKTRLRNKFGPQIYLHPVYGDGNCLYLTLSHVIFGSESSYRILKHSLISKFKCTPAHFYNVMHRSGIFRDQELIVHMDRVSVLNEWGTNTELNMIGDLAQIDVVSINATDIDPHYWNMQPIYIYS